MNMASWVMYQISVFVVSLGVIVSVYNHEMGLVFPFIVIGLLFIYSARMFRDLETTCNIPTTYKFDIDDLEGVYFHTNSETGKHRLSLFTYDKLLTLEFPEDQFNSMVARLYNEMLYWNSRINGLNSSLAPLVEILEDCMEHSNEEDVEGIRRFYNALKEFIERYNCIMTPSILDEEGISDE